MEKWVVAAKKADFKKMGLDYGIDPVIARLIHNRDIVGDAAIKKYLYGTLKDIPSPWEMKGMKEAVPLLMKGIEKEKKIRIIGDYDVDGILSTYILFEGLRFLGGRVDYRFPRRVEEGYGLHLPMIEEASQEGVDIILTCDNGISAKEEIQAAKDKGMTVVVTDHHEVPFEEVNGEKTYILPPADVILNPKQADDSYPYKNLCGAGVAWKLIIGLFDRCEVPEEERPQFLDMVAFATLVDVMPLTGENRILVKEGLQVMENTANLGLRALRERCHLTEKPMSPYYLSFVLGPCLNAAGRLSSADLAMDLLLSDNYRSAAALAEEIYNLNEERKEMTEQATQEALKMVMESTSLRLSPVLVLFLPDIHESICGLVAGRVKEKYHRPTFVLTRAQSGALKGSGRSIDAYQMYEELVPCQELLTVFGGHAQAAGVTLPEENLEAFRNLLNSKCRLTKDDLIDKITVDAAIPMAYFSKRLVSQMQLLAPFGVGNPRPLFAQKDLKVVDARVLGSHKSVLRMRVTDGNDVSMSAVYFGDEAERFFDEIHKKDKVAVTFYPDINVYQGRETLQLVVQNYKVY